MDVTHLSAPTYSSGYLDSDVRAVSTVLEMRRWLTHDGEEDAAFIPAGLDGAADGSWDGYQGWVLELVESLCLLHVRFSSR